MLVIGRESVPKHVVNVRFYILHQKNFLCIDYMKRHLKQANRLFLSETKSLFLRNKAEVTLKPATKGPTLFKQK